MVNEMDNNEVINSPMADACGTPIRRRFLIEQTGPNKFQIQYRTLSGTKSHMSFNGTYLKRSRETTVQEVFCALLESLGMTGSFTFIHNTRSGVPIDPIRVDI